jgi:hypothetical protein
MPRTKQETERKTDHKPSTREALIDLIDALEEKRVRRCTYCFLSEKEIREEEKGEFSSGHSFEDVHFHRDIQSAQSCKVSDKKIVGKKKSPRGQAMLVFLGFLPIPE